MKDYITKSQMRSICYWHWSGSENKTFCNHYGYCL